MAKSFLTDEEVELEIERLRENEDVRLARKYRRLQYKRRQVLYQLRELEKTGKNLRAAGFNIENVSLALEEEEIEND